MTLQTLFRRLNVFIALVKLNVYADPYLCRYLVVGVNEKVLHLKGGRNMPVLSEREHLGM